MSVLRLPSRSLALPPQIPSGVNWSNPLAIGLRDSVVPALGATGKGVTFNRFPGFPRISAGARGPVLYNTAFDNGNASVVPIRGDWAPNPPYTVSNTFFLGVEEAFQHYVGSSYSGNGGGWRFRVDPGRILTSYITRTGLGEGVTITHGTALELFRVYTATIVVRPTTYDLYVDGVLSIGGVAHSALGLINGSVHPFGFGGTQYGGRSGSYNLSVWNRCLSPSEVLEQSRNPWQVYGTSSKYLDIQPRQYLTPSVSRKLGTSTGVLATVAPVGRVRSVVTSQPQGRAQVDWGNPITRDLVFAHIGGDFSEMLPVGAAIGVTSKGRIDLLAGSGYLNKPGKVGSSVTLVSIAQRTGVSNQMLLSIGGAASSNVLIALYLPGNAPAFFVRQDAGTFGQAIGGAASPTDYAVYVGRQSSSVSRDVWVNGRLIATDSAASLPPAVFTTFSIGSQYYNGANSGTGPIGVLFSAAFNRALSDAEIKSLSNNPWQIFAPTPRNIWVPYV
jgi:hypothetical protein